MLLQGTGPLDLFLAIMSRMNAAFGSKERCLIKLPPLRKPEPAFSIPGMAEGVDIWAAEAVLTLCRYFPDIELMAVLPFRGQRETMKADYKTRYDRILEKASEQILICEKYTPGCYKARNYFLVEQSDALLAVYSQSNARSGTGQTVRRALAEGKEVHFIDPAEFC